MSEQKYHACPICGNNMQDGYCLRCAANESSRKKHWRTGDRGGVRPERRIDRTGSSQLAPPTGRKSKKNTNPWPKATSPEPRTKTKARPKTPFRGTEIENKPRRQIRSTKDFSSAIVGEWVNLDTREAIIIEVRDNRWGLRKKDSNARPQDWRIVRLSRTKLLFVGQVKTIVARIIAANGSLILQEGSRQVPFAALQSGRWQRVCKNCFEKSAWPAICCNNCFRQFK